MRVVVVLAEFSDRRSRRPPRVQELFFSGALPTGSVTEYYREVSGGQIDIVGEVAGPYTLPQPLSWYANDNFGIGNPSGEPRAHIFAGTRNRQPRLDLTPYDNDGNGYVDAFVVVHAGRGGEETGYPGDIWSHKWVLPEEYTADGTKIYAYLTIPEDAKLGVSAHELGHLLFGFPDLYDIDYSSEGRRRLVPHGRRFLERRRRHPGAPVRLVQGPAGLGEVLAVTRTAPLDLPDVKDSHEVLRL